MKNKIVPVESRDSQDYSGDDDDSGIIRNDSAEVSATPILDACRYYYEVTIEYLESITYDTLKSWLRYFLDDFNFKFSLSFEDVTMAMTLFVLFADNIKFLAGPKSVDPGFEVFTTICFFFFIFELAGATWSKSRIISFYPKFEYEGYLFTFFWWLDLIAIVSMFFDVPIVADGMGLTAVSSNVSSSGKSSNLTKAGRVVRLVRLVRLVKLYKVASARRLRQKQLQELHELVRVGAIDSLKLEEEQQKLALNDSRQSKLGSQLSESITRRVIVLVLVILCILPVITYIPDNHVTFTSTKLLHDYNKNFTMDTAVKEEFVDSYLHLVKRPDGLDNGRYLVYLEMTPSYSSPLVDHRANYESLRDAAIIEVKYQDYDEDYGQTVVTRAIFNNQYIFRLNASNSIILTIFVGLVLVIGSVVFTDDAQRLVLTPIERMMNMVDAVAKNPLAKIEFNHSTNGSNPGEYETRLLETTIQKITGLLRVGFGEAGAGIISTNLQATSSDKINPLLPGIRVYCIVGFCDIHHFEEVLQSLSQDVLIFVNIIASIVHTSVEHWGGQCNKNLGNAFVIIWRIGDQDKLLELTGGAKAAGRGSESPIRTQSVKDMSGSPSMSSKGNHSNNNNNNSSSLSSKQNRVIDLKRVPGVDALADRALIGYLKIIAEINRNPGCLRYRSEPKLTNNGETDFKIRMGFGLHAGWAIEGAVGSIYKVDATYLSPHVNMAARLETSSRQYGVPLLASHPFFELMSPECQAFCRRVDIVTVKGSEFPIGIYTYDALQEQTFKEDYSATHHSASSSRSGSVTKKTASTGRKRGNITDLANAATINIADIPQFLTNSDEPVDVFERDSDLTMLRAHVTHEFKDTFRIGVDKYLEGDWPGAREYLEKADKMMAVAAPALGGDGPCKTLLEYMCERNWVAPDTWKGYRPLTSK